MLDIDTLLFASITARSGFILIFLLASFRSEARIAFRYWTASIVGSATGIFLIYTDPSYPFFLAGRGMLIYMVIGSSLSFVWAGGQVFFARPISIIRLIAMALLPGAVYGATRALGAAPEIVVMMTIITLVYLTFVGSRAFLSRDNRRYLPSQFLVGIALSAYSVALLASVLVVAVKLMSPGAVPGLQASDVSQALFIDQLMSVLIYVSLVAMSLENAQRQMKDLATNDPLTGLANRRGIQEKSSKLLIAGLRAKQPMAVLIADLDYFKKINDQYGHDSGDAVLKAFAQRLISKMRDDQYIAGRWGGEEFLVVLRDMPITEAVKFAEELCLRVSSEEFDIGQGTITVTTSIGVASIESCDRGFEAAIKKADAALYEAKRHGRNRVQCFVSDCPDSTGSIQKTAKDDKISSRSNSFFLATNRL